MRVNELVGSIHTYEMTLLESQRPKETAFRVSKNEEKETKNLKDLTRDKLVHMAKQIKQAMILKTRSNKNQDSIKGKQINNSSKEKGKGISKGKRIKCFNYGGLGHFSIDCPSPKDIKKSMQAIWSDTDFDESDSTTSKDVRYNQNDFLTFVAFIDLEHDSDCECEYSNEQNVIFFNNLAVEYENLIKKS